MSNYLSGLDLNAAITDVNEEAEKATKKNLQKIAGLLLKGVTGGLSDDPVVAQQQTDAILASIQAGGGIAAVPTAAPINAPLALGAGSPVTPMAPAPATPSPEEIIGQKFVAALPTADIDTVLAFIDEVTRTGVDYNRCTRILQAVQAAPNANQLIEYIEKLVHGSDSLVTDPTTRSPELKSLIDLRDREAQWKDTVLDIASAIAGTRVTISNSGTRPVIDRAIRDAKKLLAERTELVDSIHSEFGVSLGSLTMTAYVAAAKAAAAGTTTQIPAATAVIDLLAEINQDTAFKKGRNSDRVFADRVKDLVRGALATQTLCYDAAAANGFRNVRSDMDLLDIAYEVLDVMASRKGLIRTPYTMPAKPTI